MRSGLPLRRDVVVWLLTGAISLVVMVWVVRVHMAATNDDARDVASVSIVTPSASPAPVMLGQPSQPPVQMQSVRVAPAWVATMAARTGIPARALSAYASAQLTLSRTKPQCHLAWTMLAGIGLVESGQGQHGGATLLPDGTTSIRILGPALDGTNGNIAIRATAEGLRLDGDARWDHAVGPMQFTPSTWAHWGVSVDGGTPDPNNIDDASLTAGDYLCAAGGDLGTAAGWRAALAAYNAPAAYAVEVTNAANTYARASTG